MEANIKVTKEQVELMDKEQLIDYLLIVWTDLVKNLPSDPQTQRDFFKDHKISDMRGCALYYTD